MHNFLTAGYFKIYKISILTNILSLIFILYGECNSFMIVRRWKLVSHNGNTIFFYSIFNLPETGRTEKNNITMDSKMERNAMQSNPNPVSLGISLVQRIWEDPWFSISVSFSRPLWNVGGEEGGSEQNGQKRRWRVAWMTFA